MPIWKELYTALASIAQGNCGATSAGLVHVSRMTALQNLYIQDCDRMEQAEVVQHLRVLILYHSLSAVYTTSEVLEAMPGEAQQLPCHWISVKQTSPGSYSFDQGG